MPHCRSTNVEWGGCLLRSLHSDRGDRVPTIVGAKVLTSQEPLRLLRQIAARKVIVIDACRSRARLPTDRPFSPEMVRTEVERQSLDTIKCWMGWTHFLCTTLPKGKHPATAALFRLTR